MRGAAITLSDESTRVRVRARSTPTFCGVEHEYDLRDGEQQEDAGVLVTRRSTPGRGSGGPDRSADQPAWAGTVAADGRKAVIGTPAVSVRPGFTGELVRYAVAGRARLRGVLPGEHRVAGTGTRVCVSVPDGTEVTVARRFVDRFAPAMMLLMDQAESPGMLVRPRPTRLELGGEYVTGTQLRAAVTFAVGAIMTCAAPSWTWRPRPPEVRAEVVASPQRFGFYVDRRAFGTDLYERGRSCPIPLSSGGVSSAQAQLEACWTVARWAVRPFAAPEELRLVDDVVAGRRALPLEDHHHRLFA